MVEIISIRFKSGGKEYYFNPNGVPFKEGDGVIVETSRGVEYARCVKGNTMIDEIELTAPLRPVVRRATAEDDRLVEKNKERKKYALSVCQQKIADHGLDMKLVGAEYSFDGSKVVFYFTSEGRVDFRALVKSLASIFHTRIELRQIGIRDEAKLLGGLGVCGRPFCCASFLKDFQPVSIKMAKTQNLSLNPTKISGTCGRLMCCLNYEQNAYEDLMKTSPRADSFVETPDGAGTIISVNTLRETCRVRLDSAPDTLNTYHNCELRVIRSGKGKRPEGYVEPPKSELEKLRKAPAYPEEQFHSGTLLSAALDNYMAAQEAQESLDGASHSGGSGEHRTRHRGGGRSRGGRKSSGSHASGTASHGKSRNKGGRSHWRRRGGGHRKPPTE